MNNPFEILARIGFVIVMVLAFPVMIVSSVAYGVLRFIFVDEKLSDLNDIGDDL